MGGAFRRLKAVIGNALTWAVGWAVGGVGLAVVTHLFAPFGPLGEKILIWAAEAGALGFIVGGGFSLLVSVVYRNRRLSDLSPTWFGLMGACVGMAFPVAAFVVPTVIAGGSLTMAGVLWPLGLFGGLGAAVSVGSLKIAQKAPGLSDGSMEPAALEAGGSVVKPE